MSKIDIFKTQDTNAIDRDSVSDRVFGHMRKEIFSGKFQPGEPLKEMALARAYGVSQSSVRVALQLLLQQGLVEQRPHHGTCITSFTPEEMVERIRVRIVLESFAAVEAKQRMNAESLGLLAGKAIAIDDAVKSGKQKPVITELDFEFHKTLWLISGNRTLQKMLEYLSAPLFVFIMLKMLSYGERHLDRVNPHTVIVEALHHGSSEQLEEAIRTHITASWYPYLRESPNLSL